MQRTQVAALAVAAVVAVAGIAFSLKGGPQVPVETLAPSSPAPFQEGTPASALWTYVQGDFAGERLERATWTKYKELVLWPTEPKWESAYVVRSYRIGSDKFEGKRATCECTYDTLGELNLENFKYQRSPTVQVVPYQLEAGKEAWKLGLPMLRPHVGPEAAVAYLKRMEVGYPTLKATIEASIQAIEAQAKAKP